MLLWPLFLATTCLMVYSTSMFSSTLFLVAYAVILGMNFSLMNMNWIFFSVVILFVGGMMIMFLYLSMLTSSAKVSTLKKLLLGSSTILLLFISSISTSTSDMAGYSSLEKINGLYTNETSAFIWWLIVYLVLGLILSMIFLEQFSGPLKFYSKF